MRSFDRLAEFRVGVDLGLGVANSALPLETRNPAMRQRTGEPIPRGEWLPSVENRRHLGDDRQAEVTPA